MSSITTFWKDTIGRGLTPEELTAYTENSPRRNILLDMRSREMDSLLTSHYPIEVGAMLNPFYPAYGVREFRGLAIDPIYEVQGLRDPRYKMLDKELSSAIPDISEWLRFNSPAILILENVLNYVDRSDVQTVLRLLGINALIIGNDFTALWGDKHSGRITSVGELQKLLNDWRFQPLDAKHEFATEATLCGVYIRKS